MLKTVCPLLKGCSSAIPFRGKDAGWGDEWVSKWVGERKASIPIHVFLHIHPHSTSPDGNNYVPDLVNDEALEFTVVNATDISKIRERQGQG